MKYFASLQLILLLALSYQSFGQFYDDPKNHDCLQCHSQQTYSFHNEMMDTEEKRLMNPYLIIDTTQLRTGVHQSFDCTDCHSFDYTTYPHLATLKLEPMMTCLDCHGGDESFAKYEFERIDEEVKKSIHYQSFGENFTCSKCHDQHYYSATARTSSSIVEIVEISNEMCLSCHNDMKKFSLVSESDKAAVVDIHDWLPNQELHFKHVRCIECHTAVEDDLMVSHNILSKDQAVRRCAECHSANSLLKASLYKYQNLQERAEDGTALGVLSNENYVIGSHQIPILKTISLIIFFAAMAGVIIHVIFRIIIKKK
ncbi:cytochrome c3 family protein [Draconibacterium sp. IB214405]|uniref:cytochrome c3 family protein n=1 Tax=Draconibacterium sp. IB214405 TaxID=3097352 RepID=UPI002A165896|nr:cytochrome c3 family protein [Draconibacterium sp. IB214405]MDX8340194.1 cytochrome c3 family protein [Draconibacterium sp. IB214405]